MPYFERFNKDKLKEIQRQLVKEQDPNNPIISDTNAADVMMQFVKEQMPNSDSKSLTLEDKIGKELDNYFTENDLPERIHSDVKNIVQLNFMRHYSEKQGTQ